MTDTALVKQEVVLEGEILSPAQNLFYEGRFIGQQLTKDLAHTMVSFYSRAIPYAQRVKDARPWLEKEYSKYRNLDTDSALLRFLKDAFSDSGESMATQQAIIVTRMMENGYTADVIEGVGVKKLMRMSNVMPYINTEDQKRLLKAAKETKFRDFDALCKSMKEGYHVEPLKDKLITGNQSAIEMINNYVDAVNKLGDNRSHGDIIGDALGGLLLTENDFAEHESDVAIIALMCDVMRHFSKQLKGFSNLKVQAQIAREIVAGYSEELPGHLMKRYEVLFKDEPQVVDFKVEEEEDNE